MQSFLSSAVIALVVLCSCATQSLAPDTTSVQAPAQAGNVVAAAPSVGTGSTVPATPLTNTVPVLAPVCASTAKADVQVTVTTKQGPQGASSPRPLTNKMWSMNLDILRPSDYYPTQDANFVAYLKALKPGMLRWPDGVHSQQYRFSSTGTGNLSLSPAMVDAFIGLCRTVGAQPYIGINIETGTTQDAVNLLTYLNVTKGYKVRFFHLGNEPEIDDSLASATPQGYADKFLKFKAAMLAVDSTIKFSGAELMTGGSVLAISPYTDWLTPILQATQSSPMDAVAWHYYAKNSSETNPKSSANASVTNLMLESATDWPPAGMNFAGQIMPKMKLVLASYAPKAEIWIDEIAEDSGSANGVGTGNTAAGALWVGDQIGRYAELGADAAFRFIFKTGQEHGYAMLDANNQPHTDYYTYWLYANQMGDSLVASTTSAIEQVAVHATTRASDGTLRVMLVNKTTAPLAVHLKLADFLPGAAARYALVGDSLSATSVLINGSQLSPANLAQGDKAIAAVATTDACADNVVKLPAVSVSVLVFAPVAAR